MFKLPPNRKDEMELDRDEVREQRPSDVGASIRALIGYGLELDGKAELSSVTASADLGRTVQLVNGSSDALGSRLMLDDGLSLEFRGEPITRWGVAACGVWSGVVAERFPAGLGGLLLIGDARLSEFGKLVCVEMCWEQELVSLTGEPPEGPREIPDTLVLTCTGMRTEGREGGEEDGVGVD